MSTLSTPHYVDTSPLIRALLKQYGTDSLSYFALQDKRKYFFSSTERSFLSYRQFGSILLIPANPTGPEEEISLLIEEFMDFVKVRKYIPCFIGVDSSYKSLLQKYNFKVTKIGEEAILSLNNFQKTALKKKVRRAERHLLSLGFQSEVYSRKNIPQQYLDQLQMVNQEWISMKRQQERGFSMTLRRLPHERDEDCQFILAIKDSVIYAYIAMVPIYAANGSSLDVMRRRKDVPNGIMEFLILQAINYYQEKNIHKLSLNFAVFRNSQANTKSSLLSHLRQLIESSLYKLFKSDNLYSFNSKFLPLWEDRFLAFQHLRYLPVLLFFIALVEL